MNCIVEAYGQSLVWGLASLAVVLIHWHQRPASGKSFWDTLESNVFILAAGLCLGSLVEGVGTYKGEHNRLVWLSDELRMNIAACESNLHSLPPTTGTQSGAGLLTVSPMEPLRTIQLDQAQLDPPCHINDNKSLIALIGNAARTADYVNETIRVRALLVANFQPGTKSDEALAGIDRWLSTEQSELTRTLRKAREALP